MNTVKWFPLLVWTASLALLTGACSGAPLQSNQADTPTPAVESTQPEESRFVYENVSFVLDPAVADSASGQMVPENPGSPDGPYWDINPEFIKISLDGYSLADSFFEPVISVYPVEDYRSLSPDANNVLKELQELLAQKPVDADQFPFLPVINAGQVFHSNVKYLDFQNGTGVRYLTLYAQYPAPINNYDLFYTYQGLSADGRDFISITLPVNHTSLPASPDELPISELESIAKNPEYYANMAAELSAQPDSSFTPDLTLLDALIESLAID